MKKVYVFGIAFALFLSGMGELTRLPFGPGNGLLPNDIFLALLGITWLADKTLSRKIWPETTILAPFIIFTVVAALSLIHGSATLSTKEFFVSGLYLIRFIEYFLLAFIAYDISNPKETTAKTIINCIFCGGILVAIFGFIQLKWFPSFESFEELGWDPHMGRLLSTWFDPNFTGGLFAFLAIISIGLLLNQPSPFKKITPKTIFLLSSVAIFLHALLLTYSRSSYLMLIAGLCVIGILKSRKLLIIGIIILTLFFTISPRAKERVIDLYYTGKSLFGLTAELPDATARLRLNSWRNAWIIIEDHPVLGVGYNSYTYAQANYGFIDDIKKHSASGSDSTLLTIWATTGIFGLISYLWIFASILFTAFLNRQNPLSLGIFAGTIGLLIHSMIVNSLLFTPFLVFYYIAIGIALTESQIKPHQNVSRKSAIPRK